MELDRSGGTSGSCINGDVSYGIKVATPEETTLANPAHPPANLIEKGDLTHIGGIDINYCVRCIVNITNNYEEPAPGIHMHPPEIECNRAPNGYGHSCSFLLCVSSKNAGELAVLKPQRRRGAKVGLLDTYYVRIYLFCFPPEHRTLEGGVQALGIN